MQWPITTANISAETYVKGDHSVIFAAITNLQIVDEDQLTWEQVIAFRKDAGASRKYMRFLH